MEANNSFKQLGQEEENKYPHPPPETEMGIMGNVRVFNFMSNILELYLPRVFEMVISLIGGPAKESNTPHSPKGNIREVNNPTNGPV